MLSVAPAQNEAAATTKPVIRPRFRGPKPAERRKPSTAGRRLEPSLPQYQRRGPSSFFIRMAFSNLKGGGNRGIQFLRCIRNYFFNLGSGTFSALSLSIIDQLHPIFVEGEAFASGFA